VVNVRRFGPLVCAALGFAAGAAALSPGAASADSSTDWLASVDGLVSGSALPAAGSGMDLAVSFDGYSLVQEGTATAHTASGEYGLAIAEGSGAYAYAGGGIGDMAEAEGTDALAVAGGEPGDTGADYDTAIDIGNNDLPSTGAADGAYAGNGDLGGGSGTGAHDTAIDIGDNTNGASGGGNEGAFAGAGGLGGVAGDGNNDTAIDVGNSSGLYDGADALGGNGNTAVETGTMTGYDEGAFAGFGGDNNTAISGTSYTDADQFGGSYAEVGNNNYASVFGPENSVAVAFQGDSNVATVMDPFGSAPSFADSGYGFSHDVTAVLFAEGTTAAVTGDNVYDILTALGPETGTF
jgi:hypothetical protein